MGEKNNKTTSYLAAVEVGVPPGYTQSLEARGHGPAAGDMWPECWGGAQGHPLPTLRGL